MKISRTTLLTIGSLATIAALLGTLHAQQAVPAAGPTRVAVCEVAEVFNNYKRAKDETVKLEANRRTLNAEKDKRTKAIEQLKDELDALNEGSPKYDQVFKQLQKKTIELRAWLQFQDTLAASDHHRLTRAMHDQIMAMIARIAKEQRIDLVIYREGASPKTTTTAELLRIIRNRKVLYSADRIDLTAQVLRRLNEGYARDRKGG